MLFRSPSDFNEANQYINDVNICFTNNKRKEINQIKMQQLYNKYSRHGLRIAALSYDDRSQDVILNKTMPIISKVNDEDLGLINNQRYKIIKIGQFNITIEDDIGNKKDININEFQSSSFLDMQQLLIHLRICQYLSPKIYMNLIEWTKDLNM